MKVMTICGSLRFKDAIMKVAEALTIQGNVVLIPIFPINQNKAALSEEELRMLGRMHKERIKLSDTIVVVNINNYIGKSTKNEIKFAKSLNKEIIYYTDLISECQFPF